MIDPKMTLEKQIQAANEFKKANNQTIKKIAEQSYIVELRQGQTLLRSGTFETHAFIIIDGALRILTKEPFDDELFTVDTLGNNSLVGIIGILRQEPCEGAIAKKPTKCIAIPIKVILDEYEKDEGLRNGLNGHQSKCEAAATLAHRLRSMSKPPEDPTNWLQREIRSNEKVSSNENVQTYSLLSSKVEGYENLIGKEVTERMKEEMKGISKLPIRSWKWVNFQEDSKQTSEETEDSLKKEINTNAQNQWNLTDTLNLEDIGIKDPRNSFDLEGFREETGKGPVGKNIALLKMIAGAYRTPCPIDVIEKSLEAAAGRGSGVPVQLIGQLIESMSLQTQIGSVKLEQINKLELPVAAKIENSYVLLTEVNKKEIKFADPEKGWDNMDIKRLKEVVGSNLEVILIKRMKDTPNKEFGWNWFIPVVKRFQWPLVQVVLASLFIQLFQLANPLLLQQIIDKVINQSNLSALQVLGAALVLAALFQGLLTAVRTWLLIDTTDRMDLMLGSQVIDKLLRLPLRFFEKRPVGELSQRLSELGNLRGFLTGTAITSALDLLFATIYIFIMFIYSPLLTVVALGTVPLYILIILFIAPVYRRLIRKQAQYAAKTQSHLIETLGGIQTVKAQHIELTSRWKWQEKYSGQISEGFKSVVLGSSTSEIGNFLNQLSSLLIIWVGVYQVVNGDISLGQLIAFRIIAGYVTGPILRLSGLWQGFQQVGISMERLSDIVDQIPEAGENDDEKISLPSINGNIEFKDVKFRFGKTGPMQIDGVSLSVKPGSFVGIVGQSGSGKSTLMKLLPRLYQPNEGRILIDGYDISKVSLSSIRQQIGIVPQDCLLFEGTIKDNICMNMPEATTEEVLEVAKAAEAHDFIMELPEGYGTRLGERGAGLSGGQKQRIAIARTILQNPQLLVLDEATSALDYETESKVCRNLQRRLRGKTVFFITHRLSTVKNSDEIILMHQGRIAEKGTHNELMNYGGRYTTLYGHQDNS